MQSSKGGSPKQLRMLSGLVYCPECGARSVVKHQIANKQAYRYYLCGAQRKARVRTEKKPCTGNPYPIDQVEEAVRIAIQAQIAGIRAEASAEAYANVFIGIAARRKELQERRGLLTKAALGSDDDAPALFPPPDEALIQQALKDAHDALQSADTPATDRRALIGTLVQKVLPTREGADVYFVPGAFINPEDSGSRSTFQTTCIGIRTQR